jgi:hypothetical protein
MGFGSIEWRKRAEEMRNIAGQTRDRHAKETMLGIAHEYELLAGQYEFLGERGSAESANATKLSVVK